MTFDLGAARAEIRQGTGGAAGSIPAPDHAAVE